MFIKVLQRGIPNQTSRTKANIATLWLAQTVQYFRLGFSQRLSWCSSHYITFPIGKEVGTRSAPKIHKNRVDCWCHFFWTFLRIAAAEAIEVLCKNCAYVVKRIGDPENAHPKVHVGQVSWAKTGGVEHAWKVAKFHANWKPNSDTTEHY